MQWREAMQTLPIWVCTRRAVVHAPHGRWCMHQPGCGACTRRAVVHAPDGLWCMHQSVGGAVSKFDLYWVFQCIACTRRPLVHAPDGLWCMHQTAFLCMHLRAFGACTRRSLVQMVHFRESPWRSQHLLFRPKLWLATLHRGPLRAAGCVMCLPCSICHAMCFAGVCLHTYLESV